MKKELTTETLFRYMNETGLYTQKYIDVQNELIQLLESQVADLTMMSKIELGNDVIEEIKRLKNKLNPQ
jgi:hypothetical protein